jgi:hypothetical protein
VIMGLKKGDRLHVDHLDSDPLNNRRSNLRVGTASMNGQNRTQWRSSHGYRGTWRTPAGSWTAFATMARVRNCLGTYATEKEAALVAATFRAENMPWSPEAERKAQGLPLLYLGPYAPS